MSNRDFAKEIINHQTAVFQKLREISPVPRFAIGILTSAISAYYVPILLLALTGTWLNVLFMWSVNMVAVIVLVLINLVANKIQKIILVNLIIAIILNCYIVNLSMRIYMLRDWKAWMPNFFFVNVTLLLNAYLLSRYKRETNL